MGSPLKQASFVGGEVSPSLAGRVDLDRYRASLKICENFLVQRTGGVQNRPGTKFVGLAKTTATRLLPFVFSSGQSYVLEFGSLYVRFFQNGGQVLLPNLASWSNAAVSYIAGDFVKYIGGAFYCIQAHTSNAGNPPLSIPGAGLWETITTSYTFGISPLEIPSPYDTTMLPGLRIAESADVVTIVHPSAPIYELKRYSATRWTFTPASFAPTISAPTGLVYTTGGKGSVKIERAVTYAVTKVIKTNAGTQESTAATVQPSQGTVPAWANGIVYEVDDRVQQAAVFYECIVGHLSNGSNTPPFAPFWLVITDGGAARYFHPSSDKPLLITWTDDPAADSWNISRGANGIYGYIATVKGQSYFSDSNEVQPDYGDTPPTTFNPFGATGDYPSAVAYVNQRLVFAGTLNNPQRIWLSKIADFHNFGGSSPAKDDDTVIFTVPAPTLDPIKALVATRELLLFLGNSEWVVRAGDRGPITPSSIDTRVQSYYGAASLPVVVSGANVLFADRSASALRSVIYSQETDGYQSDDLTALADHLFASSPIVDIAWSQKPWSVVWCVRADGVVCGLTYLPEHEVWAWHRHPIGGAGFVESVCVVPEATGDAVYFLVKRLVNSNPGARTIERLSERIFPAVADGIFLDSALSYNGTNVGATTMTLTGGVAWIVDEILTLTASASVFVAGDVGEWVSIGAEGTRFEITFYTSGTVVSVRALANVPVAIRATATAVWSFMRRSFAGLIHIRGLTVRATMDGAASEEQVVSGTGTVTFDGHGAVVHVGLPYVPEIETLEPDLSETVRTRQKAVVDLYLEVDRSRGLWAGRKRDKMQQLTQRTVADSYGTMDGVTGLVKVGFPSSHGKQMSLVIQQRDPLPVTILSVIPEVSYGG